MRQLIRKMRMLFCQCKKCIVNLKSYLISKVHSKENIRRLGKLAFKVFEIVITIVVKMLLEKWLR